MANKVYIGTSGWLYKHWVGNFYPETMKKPADQFKRYLDIFNTVELNNPFYRVPPKKTFENWKQNSLDEFLYAVKANRFITHLKKLNNVEDDLTRFLDNASALEEKLGPILFQLPPGWKLNLERFAHFLNILPEGYRYVFEFRNPTWYTDEVNDLLRKHNCCFCIYQLAGHQSPLNITAHFVYVRLHGPTAFKYEGSYTDAALKKWATLCNDWVKQNKDVYVYFDNDQAGYAAFNAITLKKLLK